MTSNNKFTSEDLDSMERASAAFQCGEGLPPKTPDRERDEMTADICRKISAMTPDQLRRFADVVKEKAPDIWETVFADIYPD